MELVQEINIHAIVCFIFGFSFGLLIVVTAVYGSELGENQNKTVTDLNDRSGVCDAEKSNNSSGPGAESIESVGLEDVGSVSATSIVEFLSSGFGLFLCILGLVLCAVLVGGLSQNTGGRSVDRVDLSSTYIDSGQTIETISEFPTPSIIDTLDNDPLGHKITPNVTHYGGGILEYGGGTSNNYGAFVDSGERYCAFYNKINLEIIDKASGTITDSRVIAYMRTHPELKGEIRELFGYTAGVEPTYNDIFTYMAFRLYNGEDLFGLGQPYDIPTVQTYDLYSAESGVPNVD